jgi:nicotinamidase-related amidase
VGSDLYLCGFTTDVWMFYTACGALRPVFRTFLIEDASMGVDIPPGSIERTKMEMVKREVVISLSSSIFTTFF